MADIAIGTNGIRLTHPQNSIRWNGMAGETVAEGQVVYLAATGKWMLADMNVVGKQNPRGLALNNAGTGAPGLTVLQKGPVSGFTTNMPAFDAPIYASDTPGAIGTAAGTVSALIGRVGAIPEGNTPVKCIFFDFLWNTVFA